MTAYFSYIGDIDDPGFCWERPEDAPGATNLPRRLVPTAKATSLAVSILFVMRQIEEGRMEGKQLDWGAWGLRMTGAELVAFFGPDHAYAMEIAMLDPARDYVLERFPTTLHRTRPRRSSWSTPVGSRGR